MWGPRGRVVFSKDRGSGTGKTQGPTPPAGGSARAKIKHLKTGGGVSREDRKGRDNESRKGPKKGPQYGTGLCMGILSLYLTIVTIFT